MDNCEWGLLLIIINRPALRLQCSCPLFRLANNSKPNQVDTGKLLKSPRAHILGWLTWFSLDLFAQLKGHKQDMRTGNSRWVYRLGTSGVELRITSPIYITSSIIQRAGKRQVLFLFIHLWQINLIDPFPSHHPSSPCPIIISYASRGP